MPYWLDSLARSNHLLFITSISGRETVSSCLENDRVRDFIALASGPPLPLVLRSEGDSYRLIGFAEVDGLMKREMWIKATDEDLIDLVLTRGTIHRSNNTKVN